MAQDYTFKPNVDITGIASLMQKKAMAEQDQKNFQRQQRLKELEFALTTGATFAKGMVEASKMRQQKEFANAVADMFKTPGQTEVLGVSAEESRVPAPGPVSHYATGSTGQVGGRGEPSIPVAEATAQTQMGAPTDNAISNAARKGALVDAPGASKQMFEQLFSERKGVAGKDGELQKLTLQGTKGSRNVQVMQIGSNFYKPGTNEPVDIYDPAQVDALPEATFVARAYKAGTTTDGRTVMADPNDRQNPLKIMNSDGTMGEPYGGELRPLASNPTDRAIDDMQAVIEAEGNLNEGMKYWSSKVAGPVAGRLTTVQSWFNSMVDEDKEAFRNYMSEIDAIRRHNYYGAQLTEGERKSFGEISMDTKLSPKALLVRIGALRRKLRNRAVAVERASRAGNRPFREGDLPQDRDEAPMNNSGAVDLGGGFSYEVIP